MARLIERTFNPTAPVIVRRFFVAAGRHWNPGDTFNWSKLSIAQRRVKQLFDAGKLMHADEPVEIPPKLKAEVETATPTIQQEVEDEDIHHVAATSDADADAADEQSISPAEDDGLGDLNMKELRAIADEEGAPFRVSRAAQAEAIRETRRERTGE